MKPDLYHNRSGVRDPVAAKAIREADRQPEHVSKAVELMKFTAGNLDCEVVGRIVLRDKKNGEGMAMTERKKELPSISLEHLLTSWSSARKLTGYPILLWGMRIRAFRIIFMRWNLRTINTICTMRP